jgi:hypothetical protein
LYYWPNKYFSACFKSQHEIIFIWYRSTFFLKFHLVYYFFRVFPRSFCISPIVWYKMLLLLINYFI